MRYWKEMLLIIAGAIIVFFVAKELDTSETIISFLGRYEKYDLDEFLTVLIFLVFALAFFAVNQWREVVRLNQSLQIANNDLMKALSDVRVLREILPICSNCKKIRDDDGYWKQVELYISENTNTLFSHGICPDCLEKMYPDYAEQLKNEQERA